MTRNDIISVIVPIYNVEKYIHKCVDSIINQTYKNLEIILVDDGSPDNCPRICDEYSQNDNRIKVIHKGNGGLSDARNAGLKIATGEYISFIDGDDYIDDNMYETAMQEFSQTDCDIVSLGAKWVDENGNILRDDNGSEKSILNTFDAMRQLLNDGKLKQHVWNKIYKRDVVINVSFAKGKFHEDVFWSYQAVGNSKFIAVVPMSCYNYVQRSSSIMGAGFSEKRLDVLEANENRCEYIKGKFPELYNNALNVYIGTCMYQLQCALRANSGNIVTEKIINRTRKYKKDNFYLEFSKKQQFWIKLFLRCPKLTCKVRNRLGINVE